jgi:Ice-binding-like/IPTL-CTERM motif
MYFRGFITQDNVMNTQITVTPQFLRFSRGLSASRSARAHARASLTFAALLLSASLCAGALAATAPPLGSTSTYGVVSTTFTNSNLAPQTIITGDVCYTTAPVTPPMTISGATVVPCPPAAGVDQGLAVANINGQACVSLGAGAVTLDSVVIGGNLAGVIPPGCYSSGGAMLVTVSTTVTLTGGGVYIFRPGGALTTGADSRVLLANGACASDVFWAPGAAATLGANAAFPAAPTFAGSILTAAGISIGHFANMTGRALAFGGTVTTDATTVTVPTCAPFVAAGNPTIVKAFNPTIINAGGVSTLAVTLNNPNAAIATLTAPLIDTLPAGVVIAATPNASSTCGGAGAPVAIAAGSTVTLPAGRTIPANGSCVLTVDVTSAVLGSYLNTIPIGGLATSNGNSLTAANAILTVAVPAPTLSEWAMILLTGLLALGGFAALRRQER